MSNSKNGALGTSETVRLDRRTAFEVTATGGIALAMTMFGGLLDETAAQQPAGARTHMWSGGRIRRVMTGHNAKGRSCVISDEVMDLATPGTGMAVRLLVATPDEPLGPVPTGESRLLRPASRPGDPVVGAHRAVFGAMQPSKDPKPNRTNRVGFHRTATLDYQMFLTNSIVLVLDEEEVTINAGDLVIQRNTDHAWRNDTGIPTHFFVMSVGIAAPKVP